MLKKWENVWIQFVTVEGGTGDYGSRELLKLKGQHPFRGMAIGTCLWHSQIGEYSVCIRLSVGYPEREKRKTTLPQTCWRWVLLVVWSTSLMSCSCRWICLLMGADEGQPTGLSFEVSPRATPPNPAVEHKRMQLIGPESERKLAQVKWKRRLNLGRASGATALQEVVDDGKLYFGYFAIFVQIETIWCVECLLTVDWKRREGGGGVGLVRASGICLRVQPKREKQEF